MDTPPYTSSPKQPYPFAYDNAQRRLGILLDKAISLHGADMGNIQRLNHELRALEIIVQRGFKADFVDHFKLVRISDDSACGRALRAGAPVLIPDINAEPSFEPHRAIGVAAGFRAVISTPLLNRSGSVIGVCSLHFRHPLRHGQFRMDEPLAQGMVRAMEKIYNARHAGPFAISSDSPSTRSDQKESRPTASRRT